MAARRGNPGAAEHFGNPGAAAFPRPAVVAAEGLQPRRAVVAAFPAVTGGLLSVAVQQHPAAWEHIAVRPHLLAEARIAAQMHLAEAARISAPEPAQVRRRQGVAPWAARRQVRLSGRGPAAVAADNDNPVQRQPY
jgi:hypothetical protein